MFKDSQLVDGRYRVLQQIAEGDLGAVYMATDMETGGLCALKPISPSQEADIEEIRQEAAKIQTLDHPNIMPLGALSGQQEPFLVRDFLDGKPLDELLRWEAPLTLARSCSLAKQIAMALEAAHHAGIIHGDLKPANVLLTDQDGEEVARVLGFGTLPLKKSRFINLARLAVEDGGGRLFGTPEYISPEQAMGTNPEALDGRSDLYSLGVILYQMLAGELPFQGATPMEVLLAQIFNEPRPLSSQAGLEVPLAVDTLLMRMLGKKRADRPSSATAIIDQLGPWEERRTPVKQAPKPSVNEPEPVQEPLRPIPQPAQVALPPESADEQRAAAPSLEGAVSRFESPVAETTTFAAPLSSAIPPLAEETDEQVPLPPTSLPSLESFELSEPSEPLPEPAPWEAPAPHGPQTPEAHEAFIPDLIPAKDREIVEPAKPLDIHLNTGERTPETATVRSHHGPVLLGSYPASSSGPYVPSVLHAVPPKSGRKWLKALGTVALLIVILGGAGCGWLYLTGRAYWFNPQFLKMKASYYLSSGAAAASPQTEIVDQPSNQSPPAPVTAPKAASVQPQPAPAIAASPPVPNSAQPQSPTSSSASTAPSQQSSQAAQAAPLAGGAIDASVPPGSQGLQGPEKHDGARKGVSEANTLAAQARAHSRAESAAVADAITRGEYYFDRGDYDAAIQVYEESLAQFPSNAQLTNEIARARRAKAAESKYLR
ncbi:MAG: protein kinase domain-containing protein [Terriglobia bacterium]